MVKVEGRMAGGMPDMPTTWGMRFGDRRARLDAGNARETSEGHGRLHLGEVGQARGQEESWLKLSEDVRNHSEYGAIHTREM